MAVLLSDLTTLGLGGPATRCLEVRTSEELVAAVRESDARGEPVLVVGGGSNLVVADEGFPGTVVLVRTEQVTVDGGRLVAAAGVDWDVLVARAVAEQLSGLEALAGIPGRTGATPVQNVGAYGQEVAQTITSVRALDRTTGDVVDLTPEECSFGYRHSRFKAEPGRWVVLEVAFELQPGPLSAPVGYGELARTLGVEVGDRAPLAEVRDSVLRLRRAKGMVLDPRDPDSRSAGSFFTNPVVSTAERDAVAERLGVEVSSYPAGPDRVKLSAAWLIERAGFARGDIAGPVGLSTKHVLALVHRGGGTTLDLLRAARAVRDQVRSRTGIELVPEPVLVGVTL